MSDGVIVGLAIVLLVIHGFPDHWVRRPSNRGTGRGGARTDLHGGKS